MFFRFIETGEKTFILINNKFGKYEVALRNIVLKSISFKMLGNFSRHTCSRQYQRTTPRGLDTQGILLALLSSRSVALLLLICPFVGILFFKHRG